MRSARAFTLIEIMLVVVLISMLSTIALTRYSAAHAEMVLEKEARLLAATVAESQLACMAAGRDGTLSFSLGEGTYRTTMGGQQSESGEPLPPRVLEERLLPTSVQIEDVALEDRRQRSRREIRLRRDGRCDAATVRLRNARGQEAWVRIGASAGLPEVQVHAD